MSIPLELVNPSDFDALTVYTHEQAKLLISGVDAEREANATQGDPDACGEGFRYNGPNPLFVSETVKYGKLLLQIESVGNGDVAISYKCWGRV